VLVIAAAFLQKILEEKKTITAITVDFGGAVKIFNWSFSGINLALDGRLHL
jgi:hypothetical protein